MCTSPDTTGMPKSAPIWQPGQSTSTRCLGTPRQSMLGAKMWAAYRAQGCGGTWSLFQAARAHRGEDASPFQAHTQSHLVGNSETQISLNWCVLAVGRQPAQLREAKSTHRLKGWIKLPALVMWDNNTMHSSTVSNCEACIELSWPLEGAADKMENFKWIKNC